MDIRYLADLPEAIPALAQAFLEGGFAHPDDRTSEAIAVRLRECAHRDAMPMTLVGVSEGHLVGTVTVRADSITSRPELGPWLAALYVLPGFRRRGAGTALMRAAQDEARRLGIGAVYAGTHTEHALLRRLGWEAVEELEYCGAPMTIYRLELSGSPHGVR